MTVTDTTKHALHNTNQADPGLWLLTITHADFTSTLYYVENDVDVVSNGITFLHGRALFSPPGRGGGLGRGQLDVQIIEDDQDLIAEIMAAGPDDPIKVKAELILHSAPDTVVWTWPELEWKQIVMSGPIASGSLSLRDYSRELAPPAARILNKVDFPAVNF